MEKLGCCKTNSWQDEDEDKQEMVIILGSVSGWFRNFSKSLHQNYCSCMETYIQCCRSPRNETHLSVCLDKPVPLGAAYSKNQFSELHWTSQMCCFLLALRSKLAAQRQLIHILSKCVYIYIYILLALQKHIQNTSSVLQKTKIR